MTRKPLLRALALTAATAAAVTAVSVAAVSPASAASYPGQCVYFTNAYYCSPAATSLNLSTAKPGYLADTATAQQRLVSYGPGPVDGRFGSRTRAATIAFQADYGLPADGIIGPMTWDCLWLCSTGWRPTRSA